MMRQGLLDECRALHREVRSAAARAAASSGEAAGAGDRGKRASNPLAEAGSAGHFTRGIMQAIGFKELFPLLEAEPAAPSEFAALQRRCVDRLKTGTRQYARKQLRWVRNRFVGNGVPVTVLETTDVEQWDAAVSAPARDVVRRLVEGEELPPPAPGRDAVALVREEKERIARDEERRRRRSESRKRAREAKHQLNLQRIAEHRGAERDTEVMEGRAQGGRDNGV